MKTFHHTDTYLHEQAKHKQNPQKRQGRYYYYNISTLAYFHIQVFKFRKYCLFVLTQIKPKCTSSNVSFRLSEYSYNWQSYTVYSPFHIHKVPTDLIACTVVEIAMIRCSTSRYSFSTLRGRPWLRTTNRCV